MFNVIVVSMTSAFWIFKPFTIICLLGQILLLVAILVTGQRMLIGLILFLVYVGGLIILIRYCVIITPHHKIRRAPFLLPLVFLTQADINCYSLGLLYSIRILFFIGFLLYIVMLSVVDLVDYSSGILK